MFQGLVCLLTILMLTTAGVHAQKSEDRAADEAAIRQVLDQLAAAWTRGDGKMFAEPFVEDADFIVWNGTYVKGRDQIAEGHQRILSTVYKDTKLKIEVRRIRFLGPDAAVVHTAGDIAKKAEAFTDFPAAFPLYVFSKNNGKWQIVAFQNTANSLGRPPAKN